MTRTQKIIILATLQIGENHIFFKNSKFDILAGGAKIDDIWPKIITWGALEHFFVRLYHFKPLASLLEKIEKIKFSNFENSIFPQFRPKIRSFRPNIGRKMMWPGFNPPGLFLKKNAQAYRTSFGLYPEIRIFDPGTQKCLFSHVADFLGTCHFLGTTIPMFKKFKIRAFRKVYGLWGYF